MALTTGDARPIYQQIADGIKDLIITGSLGEGQRAPSTNELSAFHSVNPTTSAKALTQLNLEGIVEKKRGLGMFVTAGAREKIRAERKQHFARNYVEPLVQEATTLGLSEDEVVAWIKEGLKA